MVGGPQVAGVERLAALAQRDDVVGGVGTGAVAQPADATVTRQHVGPDPLPRSTAATTVDTAQGWHQTPTMDVRRFGWLLLWAGLLAVGASAGDDERSTVMIVGGIAAVIGVGVLLTTPSRSST